MHAGFALWHGGRGFELCMCNQEADVYGGVSSSRGAVLLYKLALGKDVATFFSTFAEISGRAMSSTCRDICLEIWGGKGYVVSCRDICQDVWSPERGASSGAHFGEHFRIRERRNSVRLLPFRCQCIRFETHLVSF
jgi:hypothetical protein